MNAKANEERESNVAGKIAMLPVEKCPEAWK